jgi:hypothetical protein
LLNPGSLLTFLDTHEFTDYWYNAAKPDSLVELIEKNPELYFFSGTAYPPGFVETANVDAKGLSALLFQAGYLTVAGKNRYGYLLLDVPNKAARLAFNRHVLMKLSNMDEGIALSCIEDLFSAFTSGDMGALESVLKRLLAHTPNGEYMENMRRCQGVFYTALQLLAAKAEAFVSTPHGYIDAVVETAGRVYAIGFKHAIISGAEPGPGQIGSHGLRVDANLEAVLDTAMARIEELGYVKGHASQGKQAYKVAVALAGLDNVALRVEEA